ncbi:MAG: type II toxin-antitoxin system VapC family toxin [Verrucomicrobiales bacterium]|nr:type II toxin-antitoxin system VapC family toxin [Verrucomicrobiales bacterium]
MGLILDTNFVITAERDARRGVPGKAHAFLAAHPSDTFYLTFTIVGELACGQSASARRDWEQLCRPYPILPWTIEVSWHYGEIYRALAASGQLIGTNDLWIASAALANGHGVVTNNVDEFSRVPGLLVEAYG